MYLGVVRDIKKKRLERNGHVVRMYQGRTVKKIFESKSGESRWSRRLRLRCLEAAETDLRERDGNRRQLIGKNGSP